LTPHPQPIVVCENSVFIKGTQEFCFSESAKCLKEDRVATAQALSGTGALRLGAEMLRFHYAPVPIYVPAPTWGNHHKIFAHAGLEVRTYQYFKPETRGLDFEKMIADLKAAPQGAVVVLHVCSHNPTGVDPTAEQWAEILKVVQEGKLLPFFDSAYQGFASGDTEKDAYAVRLFEEAGLEMMVAQSYSKNMGLYGERIGALNIVCPSSEAKKNVISQLEIIIRAMYVLNMRVSIYLSIYLSIYYLYICISICISIYLYIYVYICISINLPIPLLSNEIRSHHLTSRYFMSAHPQRTLLTCDNDDDDDDGHNNNRYSNPPRHGAAIAGGILTDKTLCDEWKAELKTMTDRIAAMRTGLRAELERLNTPGDWSFITTQVRTYIYMLSHSFATTRFEKRASYIYFLSGVRGQLRPRREVVSKGVL
jgi:aspartate/tyrosine/aromatic aminotransferase